jgi:hypothetical protein
MVYGRMKRPIFGITKRRSVMQGQIWAPTENAKVIRNGAGRICFHAQETWRKMVVSASYAVEKKALGGSVAAQ